MSDVSKTNELIAEAQQHYSEMNGLNSRAAEVMMELVAALEAKTGVRVPGMDDVLAALDGVPEPEWEYGYRGRYAVMHPTKAGQRIETPEITQRTPDNWLPEMGEIYRRRPSTPAGPWLPVEGESE